MTLTAIEIECPRCGAAARVSQVQGDRCPGCGSEFKRYLPGERQAALDYLAALTGEKALTELPDDAGWLIAHE